MTDEEFISLPDAAQLLFVSRSHVAKLVSSGMFTTRQDGALRGPMYLNTRLANALKRKRSLRRRPKMTSLRTAFGGKTWSAGPHAPGGG
jgi:hypothetical protein